jgi:hypothetical protein
MEDTRRERKVVQEIIVQHISKHASEALPSITGHATENGEAHLAERYLKITITSLARLGDTPQGL